jgi:hypothetical protein
MAPKKKPVFDLSILTEDNDLDSKYTQAERIFCQIDPTIWNNIKDYQKEFDLLTKPYIGLVSPYVAIDKNENHTNGQIINDFGIKSCHADPKEKCVYFKPSFCEDMYSIPSKNKTEFKALQDSFVGILNHQYNETRRRNNPFARKHPNQTIGNTRKTVPIKNPSVFFFPLKESASLPINITRKSRIKPELKINNLVRSMGNISLNSHNVRNTTRSRVRASQSLSPRTTRSRVRASQSLSPRTTRSRARTLRK